ARRGPRPRLRAAHRTDARAPPERRRPAPVRRALELVRLRRAQRGAVPGGSVTVVAVETRERRPAPAERLAMLCDPGSFEPLRSGVVSSQAGVPQTAGDGVLAGAGRVGGRPIFCYAEDPGFMAGSLGAAHADSIVRILELAARARRPVVGFIESGGARLQEGNAALAGYARIFKASVELSRIAPQISIVTGV